MAAIAIAIGIACVLGAALFSGKVLAPEDAVYFEPPFAQLAHQAGVTRPSNPYLFDEYRQFHPDMLLARAELHHGRFPAWNPYEGAGDPVWASQQHGVLSPFEWPAMVFSFWPSLEWVAALKLFAAGFGMFLLLRHLRRSTAGSLVGAVAFAFSSPIIDWLGHPHTNTLVLLPWLCLTIDRVAERRRLKDVIPLSVVAAACGLGGHPPSMVICLYIAVAWAAFRLPRRGPRAALLLGLGLVIGMALAAIVLLPSLELGSQATSTTRGGQGPVSILYTFLAPEFWGRPDKAGFLSGPINYVERTGYFGSLPLVVAFAGLVLRRPSREQLFFVVLAAVSLLLAVQGAVPTSAIMHLPLLSHVALVRWVVGVAFAGAALSAYGVDAVLNRESLRRRLILPLALLAGLAAVLPVVLVAHGEGSVDLAAALRGLPNTPAGGMETYALRMASVLRWMLFSLAALGVIWAARRTRLGPTTIGAAAIVITMLDVVSFNVGFHPAVRRSLVDPPAVKPIAYARAKVGHSRVGGIADLGPNLAQRFNLRDAQIYRSPPLRRRAELWSALGGTGLDYALLTPEATRAADAFAVKYVFVQNPRALANAHVRRVPGVDGLLRNTQASPRAWLAYDWLVARDEKSALARVKHDDNLERTPVIEAPTLSAPALRRGPSQVRFVEDGLRTVSIDLNAARPAQLILADSFYPGWKAYVDGRQQEIRPANVAFRSVAVPRGRHRVRFVYDPLSLRLGMLISAVALVLLLLAAGLLSLRGAPLRGGRTGARSRRAAAPARTGRPGRVAR